jgi:hypothetical protein
MLCIIYIIHLASQDWKIENNTHHEIKKPEN